MLSTLLQKPTQTVDDISAWAAISHRPIPSVAALLGGHRAGRMAWAFASGYRAATVALFGRPVAVAITEATGNHPRSIQTALVAGRVSGEKSFVTLPTCFPELAVLARAPDQTLRMVLVPTASATLQPRPPTPFIPELPHARARFDQAEGQVLPDEGWALSKRFRALEDIHVTLAALAFVLRFDWERPVKAELLALVAQLLGLVGQPLDDPGVLVALEHGLGRSLGLLRELPAEGMPPQDRGRWLRDLPLLALTRGVHQRRVARAWEALGG